MDPNHLQALADDEDLPKWKGLLMVAFVRDLDVLESLALNPSNASITDGWLSRHPEPTIRMNVARKAGWGDLSERTLRRLLKDIDTEVVDATENSLAGDWNKSIPIEDADPY